jgi:hypothetical protein
MEDQMTISFGPDESYSEGRMAYLADCPLTDNPYSPHDHRFRSWAAGWREELNIALEACPLALED